MKKFIIYGILCLLGLFVLLTGCDSGGDSDFSVLSNPTFHSEIEGYLFKSVSYSTAPNKVSSSFYPTSGEEAMVGVKVMLGGTTLYTTTDDQGYFKFDITNSAYLGFKFILVTNPQGTVEYGKAALNINQNDKKLYRIKILNTGQSEVIQFDTDNKDLIINKAPVVDAGPDIYTSNFSSDPIKIITERSFDPDMGDKITKVSIDLNNDYIFERIDDVFRSSYQFSRRTNNFNAPGIYTVNVKMEDGNGGVGVDSMKIYVDSDYSYTNMRPVTYIVEGDGYNDGVISVDGGQSLTIEGYAKDYDLLPGQKLTFSWEQKAGSSVTTSIVNYPDDAEHEHSSKLTFTPITGNTYTFDFYASDTKSVSLVNSVTVLAGQSSTTTDPDDGIITGVSEGIVYFESDNVIYKINTQTGQKEALTDTVYNSTYPNISTDYQSIFFSSNKDDEYNYDLYQMTVSGGSKTRLTSTQSDGSISRDEFMPCQSENGRVYFSYGNGISSMSASGGTIREEISMDGKQFKYVETYTGESESKIAFVSNFKSSDNFELYVADLNTDGTIANSSGLEPVYGLSTGNDDYYPKFSKDGKYLVFFRKSVSGLSNIYRLELSTGTMLKLTDNLYDNKYPCFSTDGTRVFFVSNKDDSSDMGEIWVMNNDGSSPERITDNDIKERFLVFGE